MSETTQAIQAAQAAPTTEAQPTEGKRQISPSWGITEADALKAWRKAMVDVCMTDGQTITGVLVGYSQYWFAVMTGTKILLVNKARILWITNMGARGGEA